VVEPYHGHEDSAHEALPSRTDDLVAAAQHPRRPYQCITIPDGSVVVSYADFDAMSSELSWLRAEVNQLRASADKGATREQAEAWFSVVDALNADGRQWDRIGKCGRDSAVHEIKRLCAIERAARPLMELPR
jgi:hypothetical protein